MARHRDRYERRHVATRLGALTHNTPEIALPTKPMVTLYHAMYFADDASCGDPECLCAASSGKRDGESC